eukprot:1634645-Amphidinium_carterae.1
MISGGRSPRLKASKLADNILSRLLNKLPRTFRNRSVSQGPGVALLPTHPMQETTLTATAKIDHGGLLRKCCAWNGEVFLQNLTQLAKRVRPKTL